MTPTPHANPIPNILTGLRLVAGVVMFLILAGAAPRAAFLPTDFLSPSDQFRFARTAFCDLRRGGLDRLGRRLPGPALARDDALGRHSGSDRRQGADHRRHPGRAGLGLGAAGIAMPCGLILFREFAVSALRETVAGKVKLPVTLLAKWKTTAADGGARRPAAGPAVGRLRPAAGDGSRISRPSPTP